MSEKQNKGPDSQEQKPEKELEFSQEQYEMLKRCSENGDMAEWNEWRRENRRENIWLQGANLQGAKLQGANLRGANLQEASFWFTVLQGANLRGANLQGANLILTDLQGGIFSMAIFDGSTRFMDCPVDRDTDFRNTGLDNVIVESGTKYLLKYNIRRMNWRDWYRGFSAYKLVVLARQFVTLPVRLFWFISNYGRSTCRIVVTFFALAFTFALIYWRWSDLVIFNNEIDVNHFQSLWHACYFSVVTMTTLGFGDIAASPASWEGQTLLMVQVILGYFLLGALVTRLTVLFTSDGPAGKFTPVSKEEKQFLAKLKKDKETRRKMVR